MYDKETAHTYESAGMGRRVPRGSRPGVVVVDLTRGFTDPEFATGADLTDVVLATNELISAARPQGIPVVFTTVEYTQAEIESSAYAWFGKSSGLKTLAAGTPAVELDPRLAREPHDVVIAKKGASAFFGSNLASTLVAFGVDTVLVCGATTSGCIRASAVDAVQSGFRVLVPRDCVGDRAQGPHDANLFDIDEKYGDVVDLADAVAYVSEPTATRG